MRTFDSIGIMLVTQFQTHPKLINAIPKNKAWFELLKITYNKLTAQETFPPIENIPQEEKIRIWALAKSMDEGKPKEFSKIIYLIEILQDAKVNPA
jgi:hypothetical protein